ncbi:hypothetical protein MXD62_34105 [Frankia sp. Mgl5]|uniref:hypothetical protein n=1 Tax=Frankia sp. Mgl5 TaxID=2933793 RepID=UPI00200C7FB2|nr:hypothetical protein [Frankia sp. Mgl5]MCK9932115.1 hypothetical protein [Frankia sp. Mgl5]
MSEHRGSARRISPIQAAFGVLAGIVLLVAILLSQKGGSPESTAAARSCQAGDGGSGTPCPSPAPTTTPTGGTASGTPSPPGSGSGTKQQGTAPPGSGAGDETVAADGSGTRPAGSTSTAGTRPAGASGSARSPRPRPGGGHRQEPVLDLRLPPVPVPTCVVDCR